ncbi:MAG TPA: potassium channel family protein [Pirellulales bacterium]|nr:potassium channel family protein [Pirellulales bacterium]
MIQQLLLALALTCVTVIIHAVGSVYIVIPAAGLWPPGVNSAKKPRPIWTLIRLVSGLLLLHLFEMTVWAAAFVIVGMLPDFETALYFSLKSYTTVGYGDVLPPQAWRLVGPLEAAVGVLMLGLSTGFIVAAVQKIFTDRRQLLG